jgi:hypothetical protein
MSQVDTGRHVADELRYLFRDARARAVIYHADFAPTLAEVLDVLPADVLLTSGRGLR